MTVALRWHPLAILPGESVDVYAIPQGGNYSRIWCIDAPPGSSLRERLDADPDSRIQLFEGDDRAVWRPTFDKAGVYRLWLEEFQRGVNTTGGGYEGAPANNPTLTLIGAESARFPVLSTLELELGLREHRATLTLHCAGIKIVSLQKTPHGFVSPTLTNPTSARAAQALEDPTVKAKFAALAGMDADDAVGDLSAVIDDFIGKYSAHRATGGSVHNAADSVNTITTIPGGPKAKADLPRIVSELRRTLRRHLHNDDGSGVNSLQTHHVTVDTPDLINPLAGGVSPETVGTLQEARIGLADLWRVYEAHRIQTSDPVVHGAVDVTNALADLPPLLQLDAAFLAAVEANEPALPNTVHEAEQWLVSWAGGKVV